MSDANDFIRSMAERDPQELEQQRAEAWGQPSPAALLALIEEFVDPDPCWYDHHGYCQAHGWFATDPACSHARAKALLAQQKDGGREMTPPAEVCARCGHPFDPTDTSFDGRARERDTAFCRRCVDRCHESEDAGHACPVCRQDGERR